MLISNIELKNGMWNGKIQLDYWNNFFCDKDDIYLNMGGDSKTEKLEQKASMGSKSPMLAF